MRNEAARHVQQLLTWAAAVRTDDIPRTVLRRAAGVLADDLAAMVGARDEPEVARFHERTIQRAGPKEATIWRGGSHRVDRLSAAVANAVAADWLELDEGYRPTACHAGLYVLPALLAHAEATGLRLGDMLRALVLGYEVVTRVACTWRPRALTMQAHGRYGAVGAAAGLGLALEFDSETLVSAIGAAATLIGPAPRNHLQQGILVRNTWPASGAWNGMMAVEWATCGIGGTAQSLHDVYGTVFDGECEPRQLDQALGEKWAVMDGYTKLYACCQHLHAAVEAAIALHGRAPNPQDIAAIEVQCHPLAMAFTNAAPTTTLAAKFSMPHAVAAALARGDGGAAAFCAASLDDTAIAALRPLVRMRPWADPLAPPHDRPARVTLSLGDGKEILSECLSALGSPDRPLAPQAWRDKMRELAGPVYPRAVDVFDTIVEADSRWLLKDWRAIVAEITRP
ncbi:MAG: MmgE/PrpD family protein [Rubrivivax sp.]|nr:MmgE/PrpD family protein [Rubrivivax sp.]